MNILILINQYLDNYYKIKKKKTMIQHSFLSPESVNKTIPKAKSHPPAHPHATPTLHGWAPTESSPRCREATSSAVAASTTDRDGRRTGDTAPGPTAQPPCRSPPRPGPRLDLVVVVELVAHSSPRPHRHAAGTVQPHHTHSATVTACPLRLKISPLPTRRQFGRIASQSQSSSSFPSFPSP